MLEPAAGKLMTLLEAIRAQFEPITKYASVLTDVRHTLVEQEEQRAQRENKKAAELDRSPTYPVVGYNCNVLMAIDFHHKAILSQIEELFPSKPQEEALGPSKRDFEKLAYHVAEAIFLRTGCWQKGSCYQEALVVWADAMLEKLGVVEGSTVSDLKLLKRYLHQTALLSSSTQGAQKHLNLRPKLGCVLLEQEAQGSCSPQPRPDPDNRSLRHILLRSGGHVVDCFGDPQLGIYGDPEMINAWTLYNAYGTAFSRSGVYRGGHVNLLYSLIRLCHEAFRSNGEIELMEEDKRELACGHLRAAIVDNLWGTSEAGRNDLRQWLGADPNKEPYKTLLQEGNVPLPQPINEFNRSTLAALDGLCNQILFELDRSPRDLLRIVDLAIRAIDLRRGDLGEDYLAKERQWAEEMRAPAPGPKPGTR